MSDCEATLWMSSGLIVDPNRLWSSRLVRNTKEMMKDAKDSPPQLLTRFCLAFSWWKRMSPMKMAPNQLWLPSLFSWPASPVRQTGHLPSRHATLYDLSFCSSWNREMLLDETSKRNPGKQNETSEQLRKKNVKKIINKHYRGFGDCPASSSLPWPGQSWMIQPGAILFESISWSTLHPPRLTGDLFLHVFPVWRLVRPSQTSFVRSWLGSFLRFIPRQTLSSFLPFHNRQRLLVAIDMEDWV